MALGIGPEEALREVWGALCDHYPLMEYVGAQGDTWVEDVLPRVRAAADLTEAFPIIEEVVLRFQDCHTRLQWPGAPARTTPDVELGWVEEGLAILRAGPDTGLAPGDRVLAVDGIEAAGAIQAVWSRSQGSSRASHLRSACGRLASGAPGSLLRLSTEHGEVNLPRPMPGAVRQPAAAPVLRVQPLTPDAAVLRIGAWSGLPHFLASLDAALEEVRGLPYLVIDVRGNGGGQDDYARACVGRFIDRPVLCSICFYRQPRTRVYEPTLAYCEPRGPWRYGGRVAVLIDERCYSACTHFAAGMRASAAACLVGLPTNGGGAYMQSIPLSCGATLICSRGFPIDGGTGGDPSPLHGTEPHLWVAPTKADLRAGQDTALNAALDWLRSGESIPGNPGAASPPGTP